MEIPIPPRFADQLDLRHGGIRQIIFESRFLSINRSLPGRPVDVRHLTVGNHAVNLSFVLALLFPFVARTTIANRCPLARSGTGIRTADVPAARVRRQTIGLAAPAT